MIRFLRLVVLAGLGFCPAALIAGNSASITIAGVVSPVLKATVLAQPVSADVGTNSGISGPVAVIRCERALIHEVSVETGSWREVLPGTNVGNTTVYTVNSPRHAEKVTITIVSK